MPVLPWRLLNPSLAVEDVSCQLEAPMKALTEVHTDLKGHEG